MPQSHFFNILILLYMIKFYNRKYKSEIVTCINKLIIRINEDYKKSLSSFLFSLPSLTLSQPILSLLFF